MNTIIKDGFEVNKKKVMEHKFIEELSSILQTHFKTIDIKQYYPYNKFFELIDPYLEKLRTKYNLDENPPYTNSTIILFKSTLEANQYKKEYMYPNNTYDIFLKDLNKLFEDNQSYTTPKGYKYYFDRIPSKAITDLKEEIIREFNLNDKINHQSYITHHILKEIKPRFE